VSDPRPKADEGAPPAAAGRLSRRALVLLFVLPLALVALVTVIMRLGGIVGWDAAAHLYKIALLNEGQQVFWDNNWYGGAYQIVSYGFIFYWLAQFVSYSVIVIVSAGALPVLFYLYMRRVYRVTHFLPAIVLAIVLAIYLANGQDPFLFGLALMMGGLVLVSYRYPFLAALSMGFAAFANPLAAIVGGVFLIALTASRPGLRPSLVKLALYLLPFVVLRVASTILFWEPASYTYSAGEVLGYVVFGVVGALATRLSLDPERRSLETLFVTFSAAALLVAFIPGNPLGGNVGRFGLVFGVSLLLCIRDIALPRRVAVPLLCAIAVGQVLTPALHYVHVARDSSTHEEFFAPALAFADSHRDPDYRSHVVALDTHWEAYYFSINDLPITRGWYRQDDALHNDVLARDDFTADEYVDWLRSMGVKYVYLPQAPLDRSGERETAILTASPEFAVAATVPGWTIYELRNPASMVVPLRRNGRGSVVAIDHQAVTLDVERAGPYQVKVSYSPYWEVTEGAASVAEGDDGFIVLNVRRGGLVTLRVSVTWESSWRHLVTAF
jgi:hypothetical protein